MTPSKVLKTTLKKPMRVMKTKTSLCNEIGEPYRDLIPDLTLEKEKNHEQVHRRLA